MYWTLELATYLEDAPWPAMKDELIDYARRSGAPLEVEENLNDLEEDGPYESIEEIWPDYPTKDDFLFNEDEYWLDGLKIELHQVTVQPGERSILRDVSLSFFESLTYILGINGSGKTTLLKAVLGDMAYSGEILINGENANRLNAKERARLIAVVRQRVNLPFQIKVFDFVLMGRYPSLDWWASYSANDRKRVGEELSRLGIEHLTDRNLDQVSGGELQKVLLARAMVQDTPWLLLDEPGQQLDPKNRKELYALLKELSTRGKKIICSTHDKEAVDGGEARIIGLRDGEVIYDQASGATWDQVWEKVYYWSTGKSSIEV